MNRLLSILLFTLTLCTASAQNSLTWLTNATSLQSLPPVSSRQVVDVGNDVDGWGKWYWNASSTASTNAGVVKYTGLTTGRWIKASITDAPIQFSTIAALRATTLAANSGQIISLGGYSSAGDGGGGSLYYDATDTNSADNGFNVIVSDSGGRRYKRILDRQVTPMMWGAKGNSTGDDSDELLRAILYCKTNSLTLDGLGRTYRLTNSIGARSSLSNLATDGYGSGMTMRNINFLQSATNMPILVWDLSTSTNLVAGDGGWSFQNLSFNWTSKPAAGDTNSVAFYLAAPAIVSASRDYAPIYGSSFRDINFGVGHTGFRIKGKANFWGNRLLNLAWYEGWSGPGIDFSEMGTYQASAPGNMFEGLYAKVDGYTSTSQISFFDLGLQVECSIRSVEFNQGAPLIKQYITLGNSRHVLVENVRLEGGSWSPSYHGFVSIGNPQSGVVVEGLSFYNVSITGNGFFVRFPTSGSATDTTLHRFTFDSCTLTSASLYGVGGSGSVGEITPVQALSPTLSSSSWDHIFGDATATTWGIQRSSRLWTSSDRGDSSVTLVPGTDAGLQLFATALTANRTVTLSTDHVANGDEFSLIRTGGGSYSLAVGGLVTFGANQTGTVRVRYVANGSYSGAWTLVADMRSAAPAISLATTSRAEDATLIFDGVTANSRAWWPLTAGTSPATSPITVLANVGNNGTTDTVSRGLWTFSSGNNAYSASSFSMFRATNALCIELTGTTPGTDWRRIYVGGLFTNGPPRELPIAVTWDRTNAPTVYVDGLAMATTTTTGGSAPAWTNTIASSYFDLGVLSSSQLWNNRLKATVINTAFSAADVATWSASGRLPTYAAARPANVSIYASDFSGGVNGWSAPNGTDALTGAVTTSPYTSATMRFTAGSFFGSHYATLNSTLTAGRRYRVSGRIQMASGNSTLVAFSIKSSGGDYAQTAVIPTLSSWYDFAVDFTPLGTGLIIAGATSSGSENFTGNGTDNFILYGIRVAEVGSLFMPTIMSGTSVPDKSGNSITGTLVSVTPFTGASYDGSSALPATAIPAFIGGQVTNVAGSLVLSLNTTNANPGTFGSTTQTAIIVANTNGLITALTNATVTPAVGSITGLGTGVGSLLAGTPSGTGGVAGTASPTFTGTLTAPTLVERSTTFTPTNTGWHRIFVTSTSGGGKLRVYADYNNKHDELEIDWVSNGYNQGGTISVSRVGYYTGFIITQVRVTGNSGDGAGYLDLYVNDITSATPITLHAFGARCPAFVSPIVSGASAGTGTTKTLTVARGLSTTDRVFAGLGLSVGANGTLASEIRHGVGTLVAGTKTITDTATTANTRFIVTGGIDGGTPGWLRVTSRSVGTSFTVTSSSGSDTSVFSYWAWEP